MSSRSVARRHPAGRPRPGRRRPAGRAAPAGRVSRRPRWPATRPCRGPARPGRGPARRAAPARAGSRSSVRPVDGGPQRPVPGVVLGRSAASRSRARCSRWCSAPSGSTASWPAASSMASGRPSSRRMTATSAPAFSAVRAKSPWRRWACSRKARTAGLASQLVQRGGVAGERERLQADHVLVGRRAGSRERWPASGRRAPAAELGDQLAAGGEHVLAVVQDEQQVVTGECVGHRGRRTGRSAIRRASAAATASGTRSPSVTDASATNTAGAAPLGQVGHGLQGQPGLPHPARPGRR